ncbi:MAG: AAA family ATPase [Oscillospiraceae bacterium]|nr:AAA family ATPase [Oscillospiraceae bacterium]
MFINRVEIDDYLVFKGNFTADFCPGVNIIIGGNGTGKTTLLKKMYENMKIIITRNNNRWNDEGANLSNVSGAFEDEGVKIHFSFTNEKESRVVYIPEKDILEHAKGLLTFIEQKQTGFGTIYKDVLVSALDVPTQGQSEMQKSVGRKIFEIIGGEIHWDKSEGSFYTIKANGSRIPFANEASGFKKLGYLGLLVSSAQLAPETILCWDEPENSLNPEFVPILVDILLELSHNGVQIFIATHSEILASYFSVMCNKSDSVMFYSLYKDADQIKADSNSRFDLLVPNNLTAEIVKLYEKEIEKGLGGNG